MNFFDHKWILFTSVSELSHPIVGMQEDKRKLKQ